MRGVILAATVCLAVACGGKEAPPAGAKSDAAAAGEVKAATPGEEKPAAKPAVALDIPPLDLKPVAKKKMARARELNAEGLKLHRAKDYAGAQAKFNAALAEDPGHILARYNLACALHLAGERERAFAILEEFKKNGCPACLGRLVRARKDEDFEASWEDAAFLALTEAELEAGSITEKAAAFARAFNGGDWAGAEALFDPRRSVEAIELCGSCDEETAPAPKKLAGAAEGIKWLKARQALGGGVIVGEDVYCSGGCCDYDGEPLPPGSYGDAVQILTRACFAEDSGEVLSVSKLFILSQ
jgi:hypothetical protein